MAGAPCEMASCWTPRKQRVSTCRHDRPEHPPPTESGASQNRDGGHRQGPMDADQTQTSQDRRRRRRSDARQSHGGRNPNRLKLSGVACGRVTFCRCWPYAARTSTKPSSRSAVPGFAGTGGRPRSNGRSPVSGTFATSPHRFGTSRLSSSSKCCTATICCCAAGVFVGLLELSKRGERGF